VSRQQVGIRAGLAVGLSVSSVFAFLLWLPSIVSFLRVRMGFSFSSDALDWVAAPVALVGTFVGGAVFGALAARGRGDRASSWRSAGVGMALVLCSFGGLVIALALEPVGIAQPGAGRLVVFRLCF
jgi:hypothetical protein